MRKIESFVFLMFAGCATGVTKYKTEIAEETATVDTEATTDIDSEPEIEDTEPEEADTEIPDVLTGCHAFDPMESSGWTREYAVIYKDQPGTEIQTGVGLVNTSTGQPAFGVNTSLSTTMEGWEGIMMLNCDLDSREGAYHIESLVSMTAGGFPVASILLIDDPPRRYLPEQEAIGSSESWSYAYTANITLPELGELGIPTAIPTEGTYTGIGLETIETAAGVFEAYHIRNEYTQQQAETLIQAVSNLYYAEGIGLILEETVDATTNSTIMRKELTQYQFE